MDSFESLGLAEPLAKALASFGFAGPTPIQALALPLLLARRDAFLESETGTGKTFAYLAPAYQVIFATIGTGRRSGEPGILIAAPTQELAVQIGREAEKLAVAAGVALRAAVLLGGTPLDKQAAKLRDKPDLVVGTLGRLVDLVSVGKLKLSALRFLVLDEADRLLAPETQEMALSLIKGVPEDCARILVSATIPERFRKALRPLLRAPAEPRAEGETVLSGSIEHWCFYCDGRKRLDFVRKFESAVRPDRCLVFTSQAARVELAAERLASIGLPVAAIHAGMEKENRRVAIERFAAGELRYLLTSDLGARGLDIPAVSHILSLDLPEDPIVYTHRAGRTGRAGAKGVSIVLADGIELARASKIAVRGSFVFRCKVMEAGAILEPTPAEFFARAGVAEEERMAARAARPIPGERRRVAAPSERREVARRAETRPKPREEEGRPRPRPVDPSKGPVPFLRKKPTTPPPPAPGPRPEGHGQRARRDGEAPSRAHGRDAPRSDARRDRPPQRTSDRAPRAGRDGRHDGPPRAGRPSSGPRDPSRDPRRSGPKKES